MFLICLGLLACAVSGLPGLPAARRAAWPAVLHAALMVAGAICGLAAVVQTFLHGTTHVDFGPGLLPHSSWSLMLDPLAAFFLVPVLVCGALGAVYGVAYWHPAHYPRSGPVLRSCYGLLVAALGFVTLAADGVVFIFAWEIMALAAFGALTAESQRKDVRQAGWLYLVAAHVSALTLLPLFGLLFMAGGTFALRPLSAAEISPAASAAVFLLALLGFGMKAGMMPLHFWLPSAHASAPSHVSAILSGVVLKIGIYGLLRTLLLLPVGPASWGVLILLLGTASAVLGVAFALGQHDLKRLLAYHSIENIGIILMGLGLAFTGLATHKADWFVLGMAGGLLHVWNHAFFKPLLFLAAGAVIHHTHTRQIDRLGGLVKVMPLTAAAFLLGAVAICGLPPLNGFVSEFLVYMGLLHSVQPDHAGFAGAVALAVPALALVGTLAVACFVKAFGTVFLGLPRGTAHSGNADPSWWMLLPMALLVTLCVAIGLFPAMALAIVTPVIPQVAMDSGVPALTDLVPLGTLQLCLPILALVLAAGGLAAWRIRLAATVGTWDCGYVRPTARMQYTAASQAASLVGLMGWVLGAHATKDRPQGLFPRPVGFAAHVRDAVLERWLGPVWDGVKQRLVRVRMFQQGNAQSYIMYILLTLFVLLLSLMPWRNLPQWLLMR